jgi:4-hydroxy 2-oxovalerate aldolase
MGLDYRVKCCPDGLMTDRRHNVRVLDCTIRDGGICNEWLFERELVDKTVSALARSGVDIMEIGYRTSPDKADATKVGPWRFCGEDILHDVLDAHIGPGRSAMKVAVMLDEGKATLDDLVPKKDSVVDIVRVATYAKDVGDAIELLHGAQELGYETFCNVMAVSTCTPQEVDGFLEKLHASHVPNIAVVDSFGSLYPHHVRYLIRKYKNWLKPDQKVGVHLHNNQQTAFANSIAAIDEGADFVDATIHGIGRGAGNCPLELLLMYLDDPRFDVRPIIDLVDDYAELRDDLRWGYHLPYVITGWLNLHPKAGIERMKREDRYECLDFFETLTRNRPLPQFHRAHKEG